MKSCEVLIRQKYDSPILDFSRRNASFRMLSWCNRESLVHEIFVENPEEYSFLTREISKPTNIMSELYEAEDHHIVIMRRPCRDLTCAKFFLELAILHLQPTTVEKGWEYHRLIVFKQKDLRNYLERIEEAGIKFEILRKAPINGFATNSLILEISSLFSHLTKKQIDALITAHRNGYYMLPRKLSAKAIASKKNVPKTTFRDHLRKAEKKLITGLIPYLHIFNHGQEEKIKVKKMR